MEDMFEPTPEHVNKGCWNCAFSYSNFTNRQIAKRQSATDCLWLCLNPRSKNYNSWMERSASPDCFVIFDKPWKRRSLGWFKNVNEAKVEVLDRIAYQMYWSET